MSQADCQSEGRLSHQTGATGKAEECGKPADGGNLQKLNLTLWSQINGGEKDLILYLTVTAHLAQGTSGSHHLFPAHWPEFRNWHAIVSRQNFCFERKVFQAVPDGNILRLCSSEESEFFRRYFVNEIYFTLSLKYYWWRDFYKVNY